MANDPVTGRFVARSAAERMDARTRFDGPTPRHRPELGPCHIWLGSKDRRGYGWFMGFGERKLHRAAWVRSRGPIPNGMAVLHHCDNPPCRNVAHLFLGTNAENAADRVEKGRGRGINRGDTNGMRKYPGLSAGERNGNAKLDERAVRRIRKLRARGYSQSVIAMRLRATDHVEVSQQTVARVLSGKIWAHVR